MEKENLISRARTLLAFVSEQKAFELLVEDDRIDEYDAYFAVKGAVLLNSYSLKENS